MPAFDKGWACSITTFRGQMLFMTLKRTPLDPIKYLFSFKRKNKKKHKLCCLKSLRPRYPAGLFDCFPHVVLLLLLVE